MRREARKLEGDVDVKLSSYARLAHDELDALGSGIGFGAARWLAPHGLHIVLSSCDAVKSQDAAGRILAEAPDDVAVIVESRQRRRDDDASVEAFAAWAVENNGRRAVLAASTMVCV